MDEFVGAVWRGGASVIQLRGKTSSAKELVEYGMKLREVTRNRGLTLVVNDRLDVALAIGADGIHVGQDDLPVSVIRRLAPKGFLVGLSAGNEIELKVAQDAQPDYLGVGPIFHTLSKSDAGDPLGVQRFTHLFGKARAIAPVVAIGGIAADNVGQLWQIGVDGVAVISAVLHAHDWEQACVNLVNG